MAENSSSGHPAPNSSDPVKVQFAKESLGLWDQHVRSALIFNKDLGLCKGCLGLAMPDDPESTHPPEQIIKLTHFCVFSKIDSGETFANALWDHALKLLAQFGSIIMPKYTPKHLLPPPQNQPSKTEDLSQWNQSRIYLLEQQVLHLSDKVRQLEGDKNMMKRENDEILSQLLNIKRTSEEIQWKAVRKLQEIQGLITPDFSPSDDITFQRDK